MRRASVRFHKLREICHEIINKTQHFKVEIFAICDDRGGFWQVVPFLVLAPHLWPGRSGPKRHGIPFSRLVFVMVKYLYSLKANLPCERLYCEIKLVWLDGLLIKKIHNPPNGNLLALFLNDNL